VDPNPNPKKMSSDPQHWGKLTTPRHENKKNSTRNGNLKANEHAPHMYKLPIYQMTPKNITIPLNLNINQTEPEPHHHWW
jgi:hypothetical protein